MPKKRISKTPPEPVHQPGTRSGEEVAKQEKESGREQTGANAAGRPQGKTNLKKDRSVGSQAPIDPRSPHIPAP